MIVPIYSCDGKVEEWVLVELQGRIENLTDEDTTQIGVLLSNDKEGKTLQLTIGYHQLEGKKVQLKKPMVILSKVEGGGQARTAEEGDLAAGLQGGGAEGHSTAYEALGVIRHQYLFKTRPRALISKPAAPSGLR